MKSIEVLAHVTHVAKKKNGYYIISSKDYGLELQLLRKTQAEVAQGAEGTGVGRLFI